MMGAFFNMESALQAKLATVSGAPYIEYENGPVYNPVIGTRYWRTQNIRAKSQQVNVAGLMKHTGAYRVHIFCPLNTNLKVMMQDIDAIASTFNVLQVTDGGTEVNINGVGSGNVDREESWLHGFADIYYTCYSY